MSFQPNDPVCPWCKTRITRKPERFRDVWFHEGCVTDLFRAGQEEIWIREQEQDARR